MKTKLTILALTSFSILFFQNCSHRITEPGTETDRLKKSEGDIIIQPASTYDNINYSNGYSTSLTVDLKQNQLTVTESGRATSICPLDPFRLGLLKSVLSNAEVCQDGPLPEGSLVCMAFVMPDILLSNPKSQVQLQPRMCHTGTFLCKGRDEVLREIIQDLVQNPPEGC